MEGFGEPARMERSEIGVMWTCDRNPHSASFHAASWPLFLISLSMVKNCKKPVGKRVKCISASATFVLGSRRFAKISEVEGRDERAQQGF